MGIEMADFASRELLFGLNTYESYLDLSAQDLEFGFNETRRDRILRTYVRNVYFYHLNEIYSALKVSTCNIMSSTHSAIMSLGRFHQNEERKKRQKTVHNLTEIVVGIYRTNTPIGRSRHEIQWDQGMLRSNY